MAKLRVGILVRESLRKRILSEMDLEKLRGFANVTINPDDEDLTGEEAGEFLSEMDAALSSWGSGNLTPDILEAAPKLRIWAYGAGSLKERICEEA